MQQKNLKNQSAIRPLCLSFRTPPAVRPQAILIGKMIPEWIAQGLSPVIITYDSGSSWDVNVPVYTISPFRINRIFNKIPPVRGYMRRIHRQKTIDFINKIIKDHDINLVFSFSNPIESNIIGSMLKEQSDIKFISHFSDPWYDSIYQSFSSRAAKEVLEQEKKIIKNSDRVVFVSSRMEELIMKKYPSEWRKKTAIIPHCYDLKDYPSEVKERSGKFVLSYIGVFYKQRNPEILFKALSNLLLRDNKLKNKFELNLIGAFDNYIDYSKEEVHRMIAKYRLAEVVNIHPVVNYKESLEFMKNSDCLIVIDADVPDSPYLPSKLIDYAASGNVVLGITPSDGTAADFLNSLGHRSFNYSQEKELVNYLEGLILGDARAQINYEFLNQFDVRVTTAKLIKLFKDVQNN